MAYTFEEIQAGIRERVEIVVKNLIDVYALLPSNKDLMIGACCSLITKQYLPTYYNTISMHDIAEGLRQDYKTIKDELCHILLGLGVSTRHADLVLHMLEEEFRTRISYNCFNLEISDIKTREEFPVMIQDTMSFLEKFGMNNDILEIESVYVSKYRRRQGSGKDMIYDIIREYPDNIIICQAAPIADEYPEALSDRPLELLLSRLRVFYTSIGFKDINEYIGGYAEGCTYIFMNEPGIKLYSMVTNTKISLDQAVDILSIDGGGNMMEEEVLDKGKLTILLKNAIDLLEEEKDFNSREHFVEWLMESICITNEELNTLMVGDYQYIDGVVKNSN